MNKEQNRSFFDHVVQHLILRHNDLDIIGIVVLM